jgi:DnaD/phage-associated family protein
LSAELNSQGDTLIPSSFFSEVLPQIGDAELLKLILYAYWARSVRAAHRVGLRLSDLIADSRWLDAIESTGKTGEEAARELLERAVHLGLVLPVALTGSGEMHYFINDEEGRRRRDATLETGLDLAEETPTPSLAQTRPNLFVLYEQNIGPITPILAERLRYAEREYPPHWIEEAVTIAVTNNVRKWRYVEAILDDWKTKGRDEREDQGDPGQARRRYVEGRFSDFIEH